MELSRGLAPGDAVEAAEEEDGGGEAEPADREEAGEEVEAGEAGSLMLVTVCCGLGTGSGLAALWKIRICGGLSTSRYRDTLTTLLKLAQSHYTRGKRITHRNNVDHNIAPNDPSRGIKVIVTRQSAVSSHAKLLLIFSLVRRLGHHGSRCLAFVTPQCASD